MMPNTCLKLLLRGKLTVFLFHKVPVQADPLMRYEFDVTEFERTLKTITQLFRIMPLVDASRALRSGNLPERAACITFDGGYADWLRGVIPVLEKCTAHATFFIATGQFFGRPMWGERVLHAVRNAPEKLREISLSDDASPRFGFGDLKARREALAVLNRFMKFLSLERREDLLQELESLTGTVLGDVPCMSVDDLRTIHAKGFGIGGHSVNMPNLRYCSPEQARYEIGACKEHLETMTGARVAAFSYPCGLSVEDLRPEDVRIVRQCGYELAMSGDKGAASGQSSMFQIPRYTPAKVNSPQRTLQFLRNAMQSCRPLVEPEDGYRRVLMIAFHFPPQTGSSGVLRTLNFVRNLPSHQWSPIVLTASTSAYEEQSNDLIASVPPGIPIVRAFALDAARHFSIAERYPALLALPDRWSTWWFGAVLRGMRAVRTYKPQVIWSTYPISSAHMIAATISRLTGLPWVADFRDPMVSTGYPSSNVQRKVWKWLEAHVLESATACVFTTERAASEYARRYPYAAHKCEVIANGYDEAAFVGAVPARLGVDEQTLFMLHSGLIYPKDRDPSTFLAAVRNLIDEGSLNRARLRIRFRAPKHGLEVSQSAAKYGLNDLVEIAPPIPYGEAIAEMLAADLLLVFQGSNFNAQIPAKIYEYLRAQRPLLAVLDPAGDTAGQLRSFEGVFIGDITSSSDIKRAILAWLMNLNKKEGRLPSRSLEPVRMFSREAQAERLCQILNRNAQTVQPGA